MKPRHVIKEMSPSCPLWSSIRRKGGVSKKTGKLSYFQGNWEVPSVSLLLRHLWNWGTWSEQPALLKLIPPLCCSDDYSKPTKRNGIMVYLPICHHLPVYYWVQKQHETTHSSVKNRALEDELSVSKIVMFPFPWFVFTSSNLIVPLFEWQIPGDKTSALYTSKVYFMASKILRHPEVDIFHAQVFVTDFFPVQSTEATLSYSI